MDWDGVPLLVFLTQKSISSSVWNDRLVQVEPELKKKKQKKQKPYYLPIPFFKLLILH